MAIVRMYYNWIWKTIVLDSFSLVTIIWGLYRYYLILIRSSVGIGYDFYYYAIQARQLVESFELYYSTPFILVFLQDMLLCLIGINPVDSVAYFTIVMVFVTTIMSGLLTFKLDRRFSITFCVIGIVLLSPTISHFSVEYRKTFLTLVIFMFSLVRISNQKKVSISLRTIIGIFLLFSHGIGLFVLLLMILASSPLMEILLKYLNSKRKNVIIAVLFLISTIVILGFFVGFRHYTIFYHFRHAFFFTFSIICLHICCINIFPLNLRHNIFLEKISLLISLSVIFIALLSIIDLPRYFNDIIDRMLLFVSFIQVLPIVLILKKSGIILNIFLILMVFLYIACPLPKGTLMAKTYKNLNINSKNKELCLPNNAIVIAPAGFNFWLTYQYKVKAAKKILNPEKYDIYIWTTASHLPCYVINQKMPPTTYSNASWVILKLIEYQKCSKLLY